MRIIPTAIPEVVLIEPRVFQDKRGYFMESWNQATFDALIGETRFVQDNYSRSQKGTLRGLHLQRNHPQGKLIWVLSGTIFDVAVDMRPGSATFGQWTGHILSADNPRQLWIPEGFAHGFYVLSEFADVLYKCTDFYHPEDELTLHWQDPKLAIDWPLDANPIVSAKDLQGMDFSAAVEKLSE
ncbi:dTDP-4-dehydrorhamnose 3,5-epimerase [Shewanella cyperi]|uniref:dTDP-4-dehydrorhamnose 3,5-epimerase n=1 Tax=Shewanella cyperi TaxID=2814292 RepID=A0A975AJ42_9GAMM|nr:dTDP-4-dehydrorhamnose 3,5-epimerase [Shewanella cyperi]QSX28902.1 dTDP-4-dehydrorhamnose 3,5-epimerase [Shewanella cyperi]